MLALSLPDEYVSVSGKLWRPRACDERVALAIAQRLGVPEIVGRMLAGRGVTLEQAEQALSPTLREMLPDPSHLLDMDRAAERLAETVERDEPVCVWGDYDVDGATSTALLLRLWRMLGREARYYIPDRMSEGYGPNAPALERLAAEGVRLVVTVDCGTLAHAPLAAAAKAGLEVIVVDHHQGEAERPQAVAIVNPNRLDETSPHRNLAAVGVAFLLAVAVVRELRKRGYFATRQEPHLLSLIDLVALGTVCDVVPLTGLNRALVTQGLKAMAGGGNPGIAAVMKTAGLDEKPDAYHAGFVIGPRINAGGRVGRSDLGTRLLSTDDPVEAMAIAAELERHNAERKSIESMVLEEAMLRAERDHANDAWLCVAGEGWHPGVIGIVASRLKERFDRPAAVVAMDGATGKASARSVPGLDIGALVIAARLEGLLEAGGGHAMAAGFTVSAGLLADFRTYCEGRVQVALAQAGPRPMHYDGVLSAGGVCAQLAEVLERAGPFGAGYPEPRFVLPGVRIVKADVLKDAHLRLLISDGADGGRGSLKAMAFRCMGAPLGDALAGGGRWHLFGKVKCSRWQGRVSGEFWVDDACPA